MEVLDAWANAEYLTDENDERLSETMLRLVPPNKSISVHEFIVDTRVESLFMLALIISRRRSTSSRLPIDIILDDGHNEVVAPWEASSQ